MDRDIEDTRQPKESSQYSECDRCGDGYYTDDLIQIDDEWLCDECAGKELDKRWLKKTGNK